jgi:hypothetical protein
MWPLTSFKTLGQITSALILISGLFSATSVGAQSEEGSLASMLQIGSRVIRTPTADVLEVRLIIPPELRVYAGDKIALQLRGIPSTLSAPPPLKFRMVDGSVHDVYAGAVTLSAAYRRVPHSCGGNIVGRLNLQGCTASLCFPPEAIALVAPTPAC